MPDCNVAELAILIPNSRKEELSRNPAYNALLARLAAYPKVTLLYSSRDREHNNAAVLASMLATSGWTLS